ncbi:ankyrin repeat-containing domain protein [Aspergillus oleicola]
MVCNAIWRDEIPMIRFMMEEGWDIGSLESDTQVPLLHLAAKETNARITQLLLNRGIETSLAWIDTPGTPFQSALMLNNAKTARVYLTRGLSVDTPNGAGETALHLIAMGKPACKASKKRITRGLGYILTLEPDLDKLNKDGDTALLVACSTDTETLHIQGRTPLHLAIFIKESCRTSKALVAKGTDVNAQGSQGNTQLHDSLPQRNTHHYLSTEICEAFLNNGANPNIPDKNGDTPFHLLIQSTFLNPKTCELFLRCGASPNIDNNDGYTDLHVLIRDQVLGEIQYAVCRMLLEHNANPNALDSTGHPPLWWFPCCICISKEADEAMKKVLRQYMMTLLLLFQEYKADVKEMVAGGLSLRQLV